ncbi:MAG: GNAT family N-acetyltransferase, partial [Anaerolineales bacterium]|nr:GNAT family N-acetyltransferase [Anaerolineales bacterium]
MTFNIRRIATADLPEWLRMRQALWSELSEQDLLPEMEVILTNPRYAVFIAARNNGGAAGFVEVNLREYAEGCETSPVGYIEGWYVDEDVRRQGLGVDLISVAEQ